MLGAEQYGLYSYTLILITAAATVSSIGYDTASLRFIPEYRVTKKWKLLHGFIVNALTNTLATSVLVSCFLVLGVLLWSKETDIAPLLILSSPLIPLLSLSRLRQFILRSLKHIVRAEILDILVRPFLLGVVLILFKFLLNKELGASTAILINIPLTLLIFLVGFLWLYSRIPYKKFFTDRLNDRRHWLKVSLPLLFMSIMQLVTGYSDTIMLGLLSNYTEAGIYSVAVRISGFVSFSLLAINMMLAPMISELYFSHRHSELQRTITITTRTASLVSFMICILLLFCGKMILNLFGFEFQKAYIPLLILLPGQLLNICCGSVGLILSLTGHQNYTAIILAASSLLNICLNFILIPTYGMIGAAVSTTISISAWNILMAIYVSKKLKIQPTILRVRHAEKT